MAATSRGLVILIGLLIGLGIYFLPSALAILKGNIYRGQVIKYQLIILVISALVVAAVSIFGIFSAESGPRDSMSQSAVVMTEDASAEVATPSPSSAPGAKLVMTICVIGGGIWLLISIVLWFYLLAHALRDMPITLLSRFGINI